MAGDRLFQQDTGYSLVVYSFDVEIKGLDVKPTGVKQNPVSTLER
jgi:hypothetical protein